MREKGLVPSVTDLEACKRVGTYVLDLFNHLAQELAEQLSQKLQGTIASLTAENRYFEGRLARFQAELDSQRDKCFFSCSQDNRALKDELESLKGVQEKTLAANAKVVEQEKQLKRLPVAEEERDQARKAASEAEEEAKCLRTRMEQLTVANEEAEVRYGSATTEGFQRAVDLTVVLAPDVNF